MVGFRAAHTNLSLRAEYTAVAYSETRNRTQQVGDVPSLSTLNFITCDYGYSAANICGGNWCARARDYDLIESIVVGSCKN
jgi:hypothetical protein